MAIINIPLLVAVAVAIFATFAYQKITLYFRRRALMKENGCEPCVSKYPHRYPLALDVMFENIRKAKEGNLMDHIYNRFQKYGSTFETQNITQHVIQTTEPQNVKTILSTRFKDYDMGQRLKSFGPLLGKGIFTTSGEAWSHSRHMIRPNFARDQVADLPMFERHVQELLAQVPADGSTFDIQELFFRLTIDSATEFLFGESVESQRSFHNSHAPGVQDTNTSFANAFNLAQKGCGTRSRMGSLRGLYRDKKDAEAIEICHEYVNRYVDNAIRYRQQHDLEKAPTEEKYVFLHELAKATTDPTALRDELLNVLLAGRDTTASLLGNMFFVFAQRPDIWQKVLDEVASLNGEIPTYEQLRNLKYVKYCMNESLRLHPVVPGNGRRAIVDTLLPLGGGPHGQSPLFVPRGTMVIYSPWTMHRRTDYFGADALEFKPERWETLRPGWEYLPFNGGPRICLGQQYALTEAGYVTVRLAQRLRGMVGRDANGGVWRENLTLTLCGRETLVAVEGKV